MITRYFNRNGDEIKTSVCPSHLWIHNAENERPQDFVIIKQNEAEEMIVDPYGQESLITHLSNPVEEDYCRWVWDNGVWNCVISLVIKEDQVIIDRRPGGWSFYEDFQKNRPRFR